MRNAAKLPKPDADAIDIARRYMHAILLERPVRYTTLKFGFAKDAVASLALDVDPNGGPLLEAPEVLQMAQFIASGREDFLVSADD